MTAWNEMPFPRVIAERVGTEPFTADAVGRSDSAVLLFGDQVLKIGKTSEVSENEYEILKFLDGKLRAPRVLAFARENGFDYLLMTRLDGKMAFDTGLEPETVSARLAEGLRILREVDISACPKTRNFQSVLREAKKRLDTGCLDGIQPKTEDFSDFESLYAYLLDNIPQEKLAFSHGDYCLPNVFFSEDGEIGFLDLGSAGVADRDYDVFMCLWSMRYNFVTLGGMDEERFGKCKSAFFEALGESENEEKLRYHALVDEFFI